MNQEDTKRFTRVEKQILEQSQIHKLNELPDFPYKDLFELRTAYKNKEIRFACKFNSDFMNVIGTTSQNNVFLIWTNLPILVVIINIVLAIYLKDWILLMGIPSVFIAFLSSSPFSPKVFKVLTFVVFLWFIASFKILDWKWSMILGSMLFSQIFLAAARELYRTTAIERALSSELFFCYMYINKFILIENTKTHKIYFAE